MFITRKSDSSISTGGFVAEKVPTKASAYNQLASSILSSVKNLDVFKGVLKATDQTLLPKEQIAKIIRFAKTQMSPAAYGVIQSKHPNLMCTAFFKELAEQHATVALGKAIGVEFEDDSLASNAEAVRAWFEDPDEQSNIEKITYMRLSNQDLLVMPAELKLLPNLQVLNLSDNLLKQVDLSGLPNLKWLSVSKNSLIYLDGSQLPQLTHLFAQGNHLTNIKLPEELPDLKKLQLKHNQLPKEVKERITASFPKTCTRW